MSANAPAAEMPEYQQRVVVENRELDERLQKLEAFTQSKKMDDLPLDEASRMDRQIRAMRDYSRVLGERIEAFQS